MNLQAVTSKLKTGFCKLGNNGPWMPVSNDMIKELSIEPETLIKMVFTIKLIDRRVVLEGILPDAPSNTSIPGKAQQANQGVD